MKENLVTYLSLSFGLSCRCAADADEATAAYLSLSLGLSRR